MLCVDRLRTREKLSLTENRAFHDSLLPEKQQTNDSERFFLGN